MSPVAPPRSPRTRRAFRALGSLGLVAFSLTFLRGETCAPTNRVTDPTAKIVRVGINPPLVELAPGGTSTIAAYAYDEDDRAIQGRTVTWRSTNEAVARVASSGGENATVTGVATGEAEIIATVEGVSKGVTVKVGAAAIDRVILGQENISLRVHDSTRVTAGAMATNGTLLDGQVYTWTTADPSVATLTGTVSGAAAVVAKKEGTTAYTVTVGGKSATGTIVVTGGPRPASIRASADTVKVVAGAEASVTFTAYDRTGAALPDSVMAVSIAATATARFATATTTATGRAPVRVTGVAAGTTTLTASIGTITASVPVVVTAAPPAPGDSLTVGALGVFTYKRLASGGTEFFNNMQFAGDHEQNGDKSMQAFASFIFEALPAGATVNRAMLTVSIDPALEGNPFALGPLVVELAESSTLNEGALSATAIVVASAATPGTVQVDVAPFVRTARAAGRTSVSLRFRMTSLGNNNAATDYVGFTSTPLVIHYTPAAGVQAK